jgi:DNA-binding XRE family transcriptional regulator
MIEFAAAAPAQPFPELLRHHRVRAGLTQRALADLSTVSPRAIRDLESGRANARTQTIHLLADGLRLQGAVREYFVRASLSRRPTGAFDDDPERTAPSPAGVLLGRDAEVHGMVEALESGRRRVISLSGLPGVGKTRLAAEVAARLGARHRWPVLWIGPPQPGPGRLPHSSGVERLSQVPPLVGRHEAVLVLDGLTEATVPAGLAELLVHCPGLRVISTSRRPWPAAGGQACVVSPLAVPAPGRSLEELGGVPSVRLLVDRLAEVRPGFVLNGSNAGDAAEMCRRLDGLPLALELVAERARVLSLPQLLARPVTELLDLAVPGAPGAVLQTIGELIGAGLERLTGGQRAILRELVRSDRVATVPELARSLHRPLDEVVDGISVLIGHGLVRVTYGEQTTDLDVPHLLRAFLRRGPRDPW